MSDKTLRKEIVKLAYHNPALREALMPLIKKMAADTFECPECGTKVLENTGYCVKCKKKVEKPNG